ncbi:hypothetical protein F5X68DRAFT_273656 [Plectosphaerella plurivora]|uniref:BZIP domain-containing protein n=1 Tax=Plectosphaerella plurivora TaxID=936078 RepID=A0A9P8VHR2_9PEZI|nr:hypothetical protein F5X68DRAFT_273656 [Plectosphaerella plurivora]
MSDHDNSTTANAEGPVDSVAQSSNATYNRPRARQRAYKAPAPLDVPHIEEDPAERKRMLNVLAQRRYRERKRHDKASKQKGKAVQRSGNGLGSSPDDHDGEAAAAATPLSSIASASTTTALQNQLMEGFNLELGQDWPSVATGLEPELFPVSVTGSGTAPTSYATMPSSSLMLATSAHSGDLFAGIDIGTIDPAYLTGTELGGTLSTTSWSYSSSSEDSPQGYAASGSASGSEGGMADFADSSLLSVCELSLLRAAVMIAGRLGCTDDMWSLTAASPFITGTSMAAGLLPSTWRPTASQLMTPHHPVIDLLPWPTVRDRILGLISLPDEARPEHAKGQLATINLAYDMEDPAEGIRIIGSDVYDPANWEIGQVLFQRWWFVFDRDVIAQSNRMRRARGAPPLTLTPPSGPRVQDVS